MYGSAWFGYFCFRLRFLKVKHKGSMSQEPGLSGKLFTISSFALNNIALPFFKTIILVIGLKLWFDYKNFILFLPTRDCRHGNQSTSTVALATVAIKVSPLWP